MGDGDGDGQKEGMVVNVLVVSRSLGVDAPPSKDGWPRFRARSEVG